MVVARLQTDGDAQSDRFARELEAALGSGELGRGVAGSAPLALETARRVDARYVLEGQLSRAATGFLVVARLVEVSTGDTVETWRFTGADPGEVAARLEVAVRQRR
jgi:hypothetical protein